MTDTLTQRLDQLEKLVKAMDLHIDALHHALIEHTHEESEARCMLSAWRVLKLDYAKTNYPENKKEED